MRKENFIVRNRITLQAAMVDCSEAAVHSLHFRNFFQKILVVDPFFESNYRLNCSEEHLYTKMAPPRMFSWKSLESIRST